MHKVSIITVTKRYGGIDVMYNNLRKQTEKDFEWILCDELYDERKQEVADYVSGIDFKHIKPRQKREDCVWNLARAYNDAIRVSDGELIVVVDDFIWMPHNAISRFLEVFKEKGRCLITGVGNKAPYPEVVDEHGKIMLFAQEYKEKPQGIIEPDTRIDGRKHVEEVNHSFYELAYSAFPRSLVYEIGGFDEDTDTQYCGQDRNFALRCSLAGAPVFMDRSNENIGLFHQGFTPRPSDWEEKHYNKNPRATLDILDEVRPIKQNWLQ